MTKIFELYDVIVGDHVSYHATLNGALKAMSEAIEKVRPGLVRDYEGDAAIDFELRYRITSYPVKE